MDAVVTHLTVYFPHALQSALSDLLSHVPDSLWRCLEHVPELYGRLPVGATPVALLGAYLVLVRTQRWRVYNAVHRKFESRLGKLTPVEAQEIVRASAVWDMPGLLIWSLSFALMRTYAIVSSLAEQGGRYLCLATADDISHFAEYEGAQVEGHGVEAIP